MLPKTSGVFVRNESLLDNQSPRTIVVTGTGRSGTTAVIRALHGAGLPQTGDKRSGTQDDHAFGKLLELQSERFAEYARVLDSQHACWGFKYPQAHLFSSMFAKLRNPIVVAVFRDPIATAMRANSAADYGCDFWLDEVSKMNNALVAWVLKENRYPIVCVSYEKLLSETQHCVVCICNAVNLLEYQEAIKQVEPGDSRYLYPKATTRPGLERERLKKTEWSTFDDDDGRWYQPDVAASSLRNVAKG